MVRKVLTTALVLLAIPLFSQYPFVYPVVQILGDVWNDTIQAWEKHEKDTYEYDALGRETNLRRSNWNSKNADWKLERESITRYTEQYWEWQVLGYSEESGFSMYLIRIDNVTSQTLYLETRRENPPDVLSRERTSYTYYPDGGWQAITEFYEYDSATWQHSYTHTYSQNTDENGCVNYTFLNTTFSVGWLTFIENDSLCRPIRMLKQHRVPETGDWVNTQLDSFIYSPGQEIQYTYSWQNNEQTWRMYSLTTTYFGPPRWAETYHWPSDTQEYHILTEFNEVGLETHNLAKLRNTGDSTWHLLSENETEYLAASNKPLWYVYRDNFINSLQEWETSYGNILTYNERGDLEKEIRTSRIIDPEGQLVESVITLDYGYEFYCNDSIREVLILENDIPLKRYHYAYLRLDDCTPEVTRELFVYPNPARDLVFIETGQPEGENLDLMVTNSLGQILQNVEIRHLTHYLEIDLTGQSNGHFLIWLRGEDGKSKQVGKVLKLSGND